MSIDHQPTTMNTPLQRLFKTMLMLLALQALAGCASGPIGFIRDESGQPIEGVVIIRTFQAQIITPANTRTYCTGFSVSRTDHRGEYVAYLSPQYKSSTGRFRSETWYKKGYTEYLDQGSLKLKVDDGSFDGIFRYGNDELMGCYSTPDDLKKAGLCPVLQEIGEEQRKRAKTEDQKTLARSNLYLGLACEFGEAEARKRSSRPIGSIIEQKKSDK